MKQDNSQWLRKDAIIVAVILISMAALAIFTTASTTGEAGVRMDYRVDSEVRQYFYNETGIVPYEGAVVYYASQAKTSSQPDILRENGYRLDLTPTKVPPKITDTNQLFDIRQITSEIIWHALSLVLNNSFGTADFNSVVDLSHKETYDFDKNINISQNWIEINSTALPELDLSANLKLNNLSFATIRILKDGSECPDCSLISYSGGSALFNVPNVPGFTVYSTGEGNYTSAIRVSTRVVITNTSLNLTGLLYNGSYPTNVSVVLGKTYTIANISGILNNTAHANDFTSQMNTIIDNNCNCTGCHLINSNLSCIIDLDVTSMSQGGVQLSGLNISQAIKNVTFGMNNNYTMIDLNDYFFDQNSDPLNYTSIGTSNVTVSINGSGIVRLIPATGWTGTEYVVFKANDSYNITRSNNVSIIIGNTPPYLNASIPNQTWNEDTNLTNAFDLDDYFADNESNIQSYNFSSAANINITIDSQNRVTFVSDPTFYGIRYVTFTAYDGIYSATSNSVKLTINPVCGNNRKETGEECDGSDLDGNSCSTVGTYNSGTLACTAGCLFDKNGCSNTPPIETVTTTLPPTTTTIPPTTTTTVPTTTLPDPCQSITCAQSTVICQSGMISTCTNFCSNGACSQCSPSCPKIPLLQSAKQNGKPLNSLPCIKMNETITTPISITQTSAGNIKIPAGYDLAIEPFETSCAGNQIQLTISVPDNFVDLRILRCKGDYCVPININQTNRLECLDVINRTLEENQSFFNPETELKLKEVNMTISELQRTLTSGDTSVQFVGTALQNITAKLSSPIRPLPEPSNPTMKIIGSPLIITLDKTGTNISTSVKMPYILSKDYDENTVGVYIRNNDKWEYLTSEIDKEKSMVTGYVENAEQYMNANHEIQLAVIAEICEACHVAEFRKIYEPGYRTRDAIVLVHGLASSPQTYQDFINDIKLTEQPFQLWTLKYPTDKSTEDNAEEFKNLLESHAGEFDNIYIVSHSLGGIITQKALYKGFTENKKGINKYTFISKVRKVILVGVPNEGTPAMQLYENIFKDLVKKGEDVGFVNPNSPVIKELEQSAIIPRVPGVQYFVIAGTKPYEFNLLLFKVSTQGLFKGDIKNDGLISVQSAQHVGEGLIKDQCDNYWEINLSHTQLIDEPVARKLIQKIITKDIVTKDFAILGRQKYYTLNIENCTTGERYVVIGKKIGEEYVADETGCSCGNGYCGMDENEFNCPSDCARIFTKENVCNYALTPIVILLAIVLSLIGIYTYRRYYGGKTYTARWITFMLLMTLIGAILSVQYTLTCKESPWWIFTIMIMAIGYFMIMPHIIRPKSMIKRILKGKNLKELKEAEEIEEKKIRRVDERLKETEKKITFAERRKRLKEAIITSISSILRKPKQIEEDRKIKEADRRLRKSEDSIKDLDKKLEQEDMKLVTRKKRNIIDKMGKAITKIFGPKKRLDKIKYIDRQLAEKARKTDKIDSKIRQEDESISKRDKELANEEQEIQSLNSKIRQLLGIRPRKKQAAGKAKTRIEKPTEKEMPTERKTEALKKEIPPKRAKTTTKIRIILRKIFKFKRKERLKEIDSKLSKADTKIKDIDHNVKKDDERIKRDDRQIRKESEHTRSLNIRIRQLLGLGRQRPKAINKTYYPEKSHDHPEAKKREEGKAQRQENLQDIDRKLRKDDLRLSKADKEMKKESDRIKRDDQEISKYSDSISDINKKLKMLMKSKKRK